MHRLPALLLTSSLVGACGGSPPEPGAGRQERPALEAVDPGVSPREPLVRRLSVPDGVEPWIVRGRAASTRSGPDGERVLVLSALRPTGDAGPGTRLRIPGSYGGPISQVRVVGTFPDPMEVTLGLIGQGARPFRPPTRVVPPLPGEQTLAFHLRELSATAPYDTLVLHFQGDDAPIEVRAVELVQPAFPLALPRAGSPGIPVSIGQEARTSHGLFLGDPVQCTFRVEDGDDRLDFSVGLPAVLRSREIAAPRVLVSLEVEGAPIHRKVVQLAGAPRWQETSIPLARSVGKTVTARFEYLCDEGSRGLCALSGVRVWRPGLAAPAVLLISSDTHRGDHMGSARRGVAIETPVLDSLAEGGLLFEECWSTTNVTSPSHVAMMTGLHPRDTRLVSNVDRLAQEARTLAEAFQEAGWTTLAVVSVHHLGANLGQGFDRILTPKGPPWTAEVAVGHMAKWLAQAEGQPVFAFLHVFDAHHPYEPPRPHDRRYYPADKDPRDPGLPPLQIDPQTIPAEILESGIRDLEFPKAQYRAEISYLDGELERLVGLERFRSGLVMATSDHGEILEKDGTYFNHGELFPDTLHVPLVMGGGFLPAELRGRRVPTPVSHLDLARTVLDLAGLTHVDFPGRNLLAAVDADPDQAAPRFALSAHGKSASITWKGRYLLLHLREHREKLARTRVKHEVELFHLEHDPECLTDVAVEHPSEVTELRDRLVQWLADAAPRGLSAKHSASAAELAELAALGYAAGASVAAEEPWYDPDSK